MSDGQIQTVLLTCHEIFRQLSSKYPSIYSHESHEIFKWHKLSIKTIKHAILTRRPRLYIKLRRRKVWIWNSFDKNNQK